MESLEAIDDPYRRCEDHCNHDLVRGVLVADMMASDGPFKPSNLVITLPILTATERPESPATRLAG